MIDATCLHRLQRLFLFSTFLLLLHCSPSPSLPLYLPPSPSSLPPPFPASLPGSGRSSLAHAQGFHKIPDINFDWATGWGKPFAYFVFGAACTEVEVDCLTGDHHVLRTDIVMDLGSSLNPALDVGQIEGAFVQGQGLFTLEEMVFGDSDHPWARPGRAETP